MSFSRKVHVVDRGTVNPTWLTPTQGGTGPYKTNQHEFPQYVLSLDNATATAHQDYELQYTSTDPSIVTTTASSEQGTILPQQLYQSNVQTQCVTTGSAQILVTMVMTNPDAASLSWAYEKTCTTPTIEAGTTPWDTDVIDQSTPIPEYANWVVEANVVNYYFFLANQIPGLQQAASFFVTSSDDKVVVPGNFLYNSSYAGAVGPESYIITDATQPIGMLTIPFLCTAGQNGTQAQITVTLQYHYPTALSFSFYKECNTAPYLTDLTIGTQFNLSDIAAAGSVTQAWSGASGFTYQPDAIWHYQFGFHLCLACSSPPGTYPVVPFNVTYDNSQNSVYDVVLKSSSGSITQYSDGPVIADILCMNNGTATTIWQVDLGPSFQLVQFAFTYECYFPWIDMAYGSPTELIVDQTTTLAPWNSGETSIGAKEDISLFYIYLDAKNAGVLNQQFYAIDFTVDPNVMGQPGIDDPNFSYAPYIGAVQPISIAWTCINTAQNSPVTMNVRFGWDGRVIQVKMLKNCISDDDIGGGGGGGWSGAGIFFFTLFILCLVLCIAGAGWNYFKEEKRGWEIVPLYASAAKCYDKYRGTDRVWTPQMDTSTTRHPNYSNFDSSAEPYQSNL